MTFWSLLIKTKTLRGKLLDKHPLHVIGADFNKEALDVTHQNLNKEGIKQLYEVNFVPIREWNLSRFYELTFKNNSYPYVTFDIHWKFWLVESRTIKKDRRREENRGEKIR